MAGRLKGHEYASEEERLALLDRVREWMVRTGHSARDLGLAAGYSATARGVMGRIVHHDFRFSKKTAAKISGGLDRYPDGWTEATAPMEIRMSLLKARQADAARRRPSIDTIGTGSRGEVSRERAPLTEEEILRRRFENEEARRKHVLACRSEEIRRYGFSTIDRDVMAQAA